MARPERIELADGFYHVMNRGRGRRRIFHGPAYYQAFVATLAEAHRRFGLEIHAYGLMGNHDHLLVRTPRGNLSRCMRHVNGLYTQRYNRLHGGTDGPLLRGRYKAILVEADAYLRQLTRYLHRNPVETRRALLEALEDYRWSSYPAYVDKGDATAWLHRAFTYQFMGSRQRFAGDRRYVEAGVDEAIDAFFRCGRLPPVLGTQAFKERVLAAQPPDVAETQRLRRALHDPPERAEILRVVGEHYGVPVSALTRGGRGRRNRPRVVAMYLCQEVGGLSLRGIAEAFGVTSVSGVSHQISALRRDVEEMSAMRENIEVQIQHVPP